jgi:hypothetical protein
MIVGDRANEYRRLARECLEMVHTVSTERTRRSLIEMARVWTRLADEQDARFRQTGSTNPGP